MFRLISDQCSAASTSQAWFFPQADVLLQAYVLPQADVLPQGALQGAPQGALQGHLPH